MKVKCEYCGNFIDENEEKCPNCGAANEHLRRTADEVPKTVTELKLYCLRYGYTSDRTRFFIGENYQQPKAFGIYQDDNGEFIVYKNKANGKRAIRYRGKDEAYAVNELYMRLQDEILNQKNAYINKKGKEAATSGKKNLSDRIPHPVAWMLLHWRIIAIIILLPGIIYANVNNHKGYYSYGNTTYYNLSDTWYTYDETTYDWSPVSVDQELEVNWRDYRIDEVPDGIGRFEDTDFYSDWQESHNSSDHGGWGVDGWSVDSWDSNNTDWDSDW